MKITLNSHILAGGKSNNEFPSHFNIRGKRQIQILQAIRATAIQTINRGNLQTQITFEVGRRHPSQQDSEQYALTHASSLIQASGTLLIELEDPNNRTFQLENASLEDIEVRYQGNASYTTYTILGGKLCEIH